MNIKVIDPSAFTPPYDHSLCQALADSGLEVELVTSHFLYGPVPEGEGYITTEHFYRRSSKRYRSRPQARGRFIAKLAEHPTDMARLIRDLGRSGTDIAHFQWLAVQPFDLRLLRFIKQPIVLTAHDVLPREPRPGQLRASKKLCQRVNAVVVHSENGRQRLISELDVDPTKIEVIPHGCFDYLTEQEEIKPLDPALKMELGDRPVVLFFGLLRPYKGIDTLIEAFAAVQPEALLLVVGMPRMPLEPLRQRVEELGLSRRVKFIPRFITDSEIPAYFERAELVALPYRQIDQSGVLYTALAFAKPMVLSSVGGFTEFAESTGTARLVPPDGPAALAAEINALLTDSSARQQLSEAARAASQGPYSWAEIAGKTATLYRSLLR